MTIKLTDAQLAMMSAAAQRNDRCLSPERLKGAAAQKIGEKLVALGLAHVIKAKSGIPVWRHDKAKQPLALKLTAAGLKTIAVREPQEAKPEANETLSVARPILVERVQARSDVTSPNVPMEDSDAGAPSNARRPPRAGSKLDQVIILLSSETGATIDDLVGATGWLPHTARAALTGLRHRGYDVCLERGDKARGSLYRVAFARAIAS